MAKRILKVFPSPERNTVRLACGNIRLGVSGKVAVITTAVVIVILAGLRFAAD